MIVYKAVYVDHKKMLSCAAPTLKWYRLDYLIQEYKIGEVTNAPKHRIFDRLYAFDDLNKAISFCLMNGYGRILKCEAEILKQPHLYWLNNIAHIIQSRKVNKNLYRPTPTGTVVCKWIKPLSVVWES